MSFNCDGVASQVALARLRMPRRSNARPLEAQRQRRLALGGLP